MSDVMPAPAWRPIETAPKDGKEVLVYIPSSGVISAWFCCETGLWPHDQSHTDEGEPCNVGLPTHWMPLPEAPSALETKDKETEQC